MGMNATSWALAGMNIILCWALLYQNRLGQQAVRDHIAERNRLRMLAFGRGVKHVDLDLTYEEES